jgi:Glycosyltransferase family 87
MRRPIRWAGAYALLASIVAVVFAGGILLGPYRAIERSDYMTYHMAARIVLEGHGSCLYDERCQADAQRELIGEEPSFANGALPFNSPPWFAAVVAPLGTLPLPVGFVIFMALSLAVLSWGVWRAAAHAGLASHGTRLLAVLLVLTAWPTVMAVIRGQSTLLVVGLLALSVSLPRYRSGLAMGLGLLKPTLPPLWAAWQLLGGHWRAVGTAVATALALVLLSALIVSPQALNDYPAHLLGVAGGDAAGVHPTEMINWRGAAERLGLGPWFIVGGSLVTLAIMAIVWVRTGSRHLSAAAAFLATPLVLPHANQHEFALASVGILLAVLVAGDLRFRLAVAALGLHVVLWSGPILDAEASAWAIFAIMLAWLVVVAGLAWREKRPSAEP